MIIIIIITIIILSILYHIIPAEGRYPYPLPNGYGMHIMAITLKSQWGKDVSPRCLVIGQSHSQTILLHVKDSLSLK
jgi:hypothetical protein